MPPDPPRLRGLTPCSYSRLLFSNQLPTSNFIETPGVSRFENQVLRIEFRGTQRIFQGSRTEISRKRFNSEKQTNSDEQNN